MILVVAHHAISRTGLADHVRTLGHEVWEAANAEQALVLLLEPPPINLIIINLVSPDMDGLQLFESIRFLRPDTPFILTSGYVPKNTGEAILASFAAVPKYLRNPGTATASELMADLCDKTVAPIDASVSMRCESMARSER